MRTPVALTAVVALALSGCGDADPPSDETQVRGAVDDYSAAVRGDQPQKACDVLVTRSQLSRSAESRERDRERCRGRVSGGRLSAGQALGEARVEAVRVRGRRAVARIAGGERIELRRLDGGWRILAPG